MQYKNDSAKALAVKARLTFVAQDKERVQILVDWYRGKYEPLKEVELGSLLEWRIVVLAHACEGIDPQVRDELFATQSAKDTSDEGTNYALTCQALKADAAQREELWQKYLVKDGPLSLRNLEYSWQGFNHELRQPEFLLYVDKW